MDTLIMKALSLLKLYRVRSMLRGNSVLVAFSGGVDSSTLALIAKESATRTVLLTINMVTLSHEELENARRVASEIGLEHIVVDFDWLGNSVLSKNPEDRCYQCKRLLAKIWKEQASRLGLKMVVEGTTASDASDNRPGLRALAELGIVSPFLRMGMTKDEVRSYARERNLSVADRPSMACLATRFLHGMTLTEADLRRVEKVESAVRTQLGVSEVRARFHGELLRLEIGSAEMPKILGMAQLELLDRIGREAGFKYVTLDTAGYRSGSMAVSTVKQPTS